MSTGVSTPLLRYIGAIIGLYTQRGFRTAYSTMWVFLGPLKADKQEQKSAFFVMFALHVIQMESAENPKKSR